MQLASLWRGAICAAVALWFSPNGWSAGESQGQPLQAETMPLADLAPGMQGEVWTVFAGTEPEPFEVVVTGVIQNALGPGKSMILCELTDERVQHMGAVAGMSGSPLYIDGQFVGALSYQVQRFETVRFAGFTPAEDLLEVGTIAANAKIGSAETQPANRARSTLEDDGALTPLSPVFGFGGIDPWVRQWAAEPLAELGIHTTGLSGSANHGEATANPDARLQPGQAVGAALAVGDITLAGTGTVSQVDGNRVLAFGHPLLGLGEVAMPMMEAEIVTILPSNLNSVKISNTGQMIGTVRQDRLSAIYGEIGPPPEMVPVTVITPQRTLEFSTVRHARITPMITAIGLSQAVLGSNNAGLSEGFAIKTRIEFADGERLEMDQLYAGARSFQDGMKAMVADLTTWLQNPVEEAFPQKVTFEVVALAANPSTSLDNVQLSHRTIRARDELKVQVNFRDFQSQPIEQTVTIPIDEDWVGETLEIVVTNGSTLDLMSGGQRTYPVSQIRNLGAYLDVLRAQRRPDGVWVAVVTTSEVFLDQTATTTELPGSLARIAQNADGARFAQRKTREVLWETHILPDRLVPGAISQRFNAVP
jgi:hypothetical protein